MQNDHVSTQEADKLNLRQLENAVEVDVFENYARNKANKFSVLLFHICCYNPNIEDESFKIKISEIERDADRQAQEMTDLIEARKKNLNKGLSSERIKQFHQFEADESHVGDQCQVCLEEVEVGRLMKQLDCGGRHSFCSVCIDQWFANHKTCPICRHNFE